MPATIPHLKTLTAAYRKLAALLLLLASLPALSSEWIYTVVPGDNLWDFSTRYLDSTLRFESLRKLNGIEFPRRMQPGTRIRVPMA
jgi:nucleoid-associated protein YgaU